MLVSLPTHVPNLDLYEPLIESWTQVFDVAEYFLAQCNVVRLQRIIWLSQLLNELSHLPVGCGEYITGLKVVAAFTSPTVLAPTWSKLCNVCSRCLCLCRSPDMRRSSRRTAVPWPVATWQPTSRHNSQLLTRKSRGSLRALQNWFPNIRLSCVFMCVRPVCMFVGISVLIILECGHCAARRDIEST